MSLGDAFVRHPGRVSATFEKYLHKRCDQNTQHRQWAQVLPTYEPIEARPVTSHQFDVVGESKSIEVYLSTETS